MVAEPDIIPFRHENVMGGEMYQIDNIHIFAIHTAASVANRNSMARILLVSSRRS
jgi:hypothetical protein